MLEKVTDPYRGLQDYTKNTLVHFSIGITIRLLILHSWYLHSKRKMPLIQHFTFYSLHHDVKSQLYYTLVLIYTFLVLGFSCLFYIAVTIFFKYCTVGIWIVKEKLFDTVICIILSTSWCEITAILHTGGGVASWLRCRLTYSWSWVRAILGHIS